MDYNPWDGGSRTIWSTFPGMHLLWLLVVSCARYLLFTSRSYKYQIPWLWWLISHCAWMLPQGITGFIYIQYPYINQQIEQFTHALHWYPQTVHSTTTNRLCERRAYHRKYTEEPSTQVPIMEGRGIDEISTMDAIHDAGMAPSWLWLTSRFPPVLSQDGWTSIWFEVCSNNRTPFSMFLRSEPLLWKFIRMQAGSPGQ
jgi:hypothetical protein